MEKRVGVNPLTLKISLLKKEKRCGRNSRISPGVKSACFFMGTVARPRKHPSHRDGPKRCLPSLPLAAQVTCHEHQESSRALHEVRVALLKTRDVPDDHRDRDRSSLPPLRLRVFFETGIAKIFSKVPNDTALLFCKSSAGSILNHVYLKMKKEDTGRYPPSRTSHA